MISLGIEPKSFWNTLIGNKPKQKVLHTSIRLLLNPKTFIALNNPILTKKEPYENEDLSLNNLVYTLILDF